jgi:hypothetical protein
MRENMFEEDLRMADFSGSTLVAVRRDSCNKLKRIEDWWFWLPLWKVMRFPCPDMVLGKSCPVGTRSRQLCVLFLAQMWFGSELTDIS